LNEPGHPRETITAIRGLRGALLARTIRGLERPAHRARAQVEDQVAAVGGHDGVADP
jgi:hypothetical protein